MLKGCIPFRQVKEIYQSCTDSKAAAELPKREAQFSEQSAQRFQMFYEESVVVVLVVALQCEVLVNQNLIKPQIPHSNNATD